MSRLATSTNSIKPDIYKKMIAKFKKHVKASRVEEKMIQDYQEIRSAYPVRRPRSMDDGSCCNDLFYYTYGAGFRD